MVAHFLSAAFEFRRGGYNVKEEFRAVVLRLAEWGKPQAPAKEEAAEMSRVPRDGSAAVDSGNRPRVPAAERGKITRFLIR
jgi:hypothetical protein